MKGLRRLMAIFLLLLALPAAGLVQAAYRSIAREEIAQTRYFARTILDEMDRGLVRLIREEEQRDINEYAVRPVSPMTGPPSPLSRKPNLPFIIGYLQIHPDGAVTTPLSSGYVTRRALLKAAGSAFRSLPEEEQRRPVVFPPPAPMAAKKPGPPAEYEFRFLSRKSDAADIAPAKKSAYRRKPLRQAVTRDEALNLALRDSIAPSNTALALKINGAGNGLPEEKTAPGAPAPISLQSSGAAGAGSSFPLENMPRPEVSRGREIAAAGPDNGPADILTASLDPFQSVYLGGQRFLLFRKVEIGGRIFRQGMLIDGTALTRFLASSRFSASPISRHTRLAFRLYPHQHPVTSAGQFSEPDAAADVAVRRSFSRPFAFVTADIHGRRPPASDARRLLGLVTALFGFIILTGLAALYRSSAAIADLSERRRKFVSSVTHELKTPLTNIRMYIEMLESRMARNPEDEQRYFDTLNTESARLGRLIERILDFSGIERRRNIQLVSASLMPAVKNAVAAMKGPAARHGFILTPPEEDPGPARHDPELATQALVNLMENSLKFGKSAPRKEIRISLFRRRRRIYLDVSDTGPGIPPGDLKKVFDDFYRSEAALTPDTRGTGIGLAFVRKALAAMGGTVDAMNNRRRGDYPSDTGCTIRLGFPAIPRD